jgi:hypothetical protein
VKVIEGFPKHGDRRWNEAQKTWSDIDNRSTFLNLGVSSFAGIIRQAQPDPDRGVDPDVLGENWWKAKHLPPTNRDGRHWKRMVEEGCGPETTDLSCGRGYQWKCVACPVMIEIERKRADKPKTIVDEGEAW